MKLLPALERAKTAVAKAEDRFKALASATQKKCKHPVVFARPAGKPFQYLDTYWQEQRVCPACGLWEEGRYGTFEKLTTEAVVMKTFDFNIYSHRISTRD